MYQITMHHIYMYSKELLKGTLKPIILKLLAEKGKMYGYEIAQYVKEISEGKILLKEGSLYPTLHSLKSDGLLETESISFGKRTRKYYTLTEKGNAKVVELVNELKDFMRTINVILTPKKHLETCIA